MLNHLNDLCFEKQPPLLAIAYTSESAHRINLVGLMRLFSQSYSSNKENGVTGILLFDGKFFGQIMEGELNTIRNLWRIIKKDSRHKNIKLIVKESIACRAYATWTMRTPDGSMIAHGYPELINAINEMSSDSNARELVQTMYQTARLAHAYPPDSIANQRIQ